jgi:hypothetical protein
MNKSTQHKWLPKEIRFLRNKIIGRSHAEITALFNDHFGLSLTKGQVKGALAHYKLHNGLESHFRPGHASWIKGTHKWLGPKSVQFKKGYTPWNVRPIGSERLKDGCVEIKISKDLWRMKHVVIWEEANGPVPKDHVIIFADRNRSNFSLDNLLLVSRRELMMMNRFALVSGNKDLTKTRVAVVDIIMLISKRKQNIKRKRIKRQIDENINREKPVGGGHPASRQRRGE